MLRHHVRVALAQFRRQPVVTAVNFCTLALGLLAFITAYGVVEFWNRAEQQFADADRIFVISTAMKLSDGTQVLPQAPVSNPHVARYLEADFPQIEAIARARMLAAGSTRGSEAPITAGDRSAELFAVAVDPSFLTIFDLPFVAGDARSALDRPASVVLTEAGAARLFGTGDPIGRTVSFGNRVDATVTGVISRIQEPSHMARSYSASLPFDVLTSMDVLERFRGQPAGPEQWFGMDGSTYALLPADGSLTGQMLTERLDEFVARHVPAEQQAMVQLSLGLLPVSALLGLDTSWFLGDGMSLPTLLLAFAALVLTVACINYANVATARAAGRSHEAGVRKAIGASPSEIVAQHMAETALLTSIAAAVALGAANLVAIPVEASFGIDLTLALASPLRTACFIAFLVVAVTLLAGAYPAFALSRAKPVAALRSHRLRAPSRAVTNLLVGLQFVAASFLLTGLIVVSLQNSELRRSFATLGDDPLLIIGNDVGMTELSMDALSDELRRVTGVRSVTTMADPLFRGSGGSVITRFADPSSPQKNVINYGVSFGFDDVLGIRVLAGRVFERGRAGDAARAGSGNGNVVIDRKLAEELGFATPADAVDQQIYLPASFMAMYGRDEAAPLRVIGVVENKPLGIGRTESGTMYSFANAPFALVQIAGTDVSRTVADIDTLWKRLAPAFPLNRRFAADNFNEQYANYSRLGYGFSALATFALLISAAGLLAMSMLVVAHRMPEVGIRKCLGASSRDVVSMLLKDFSIPVVVANVICWPLAFIAARQYLNLFESPIELNPLHFAATLIGTLSIAWLAVGAYTLRAARAIPAEVLRNE